MYFEGSDPLIEEDLACSFCLRCAGRDHRQISGKSCADIADISFCFDGGLLTVL